MDQHRSLREAKQASSYAFEVNNRKEFYQLVSLLDRTAGKGGWTMRGRPLRRISGRTSLVTPWGSQSIIVYFKNDQDSSLVLLQHAGKKID